MRRYLPSSLIRSFGALALLLTMGQVHAQSSSGGFNATSGFAITGTASSGAGQEMVASAGQTMSGIAQVFAGPVLWIVMLILFAISLYQFGQGKIQMGFMCLGACILCGVAKAFFGMIMT